MTIDAVTGTGSTGTTTQTPQNQLTGTKDEFLKLFMAQLQNQDPLDPKSGADMVAQLAQFSSVEQQTQTNQQLADLVAAQASNASASMSNLVGRSCDAAAGDFKLDRTQGLPPALDVTCDAPMKGASVVITDANGKTIRKIPIPEGATSTEINWDGKTDAGTNAPSGSYHIAVDGGGSSSTINANWHGRVDAIELTADGPRLRMGGILLAPGDVRTIGADSSNPTTTTNPTTGVHQ